MSKLLIVLMALVMVFSAMPMAMAAETQNDSELSIQLTANDSDPETTYIYVDLSNASGVSTGQLTVSYDPSMVTFVSATPGNRNWIFSVNSNTAGSVGIAWAASDMTEGSNRVAEIKFAANSGVSGTAEFGAELEKAYTQSTDETGSVVFEDVLPTTPENMESSVTAEVTGPEKGPDVPVVPPTPSRPSNPSNPGTDTGTDTGDTGSEIVLPEDVAGHWAEDEIIRGYQNGLLNGYGSPTTFLPNRDTTRKEFVTVLWRIAGEPAETGSTPFTDVADGMYFSTAVAWAYNNGIVDGTGETTFSPDKAITRQEAVKMLFGYASFMERDVSGRGDISGFIDAPSVAAWALESVRWAVGEQIIKGDTANQLLPAKSMTRAEMAVILVRYAGV